MTQAGNELAEVLGLELIRQELQMALQKLRQIKPGALRLLAKLQSLRWYSSDLTAVGEPIDIAVAKRELRELVDTGEEQILGLIGRIDNLTPEYVDDVGGPSWPPVIRESANGICGIPARIEALMSQIESVLSNAVGLEAIRQQFELTLQGFRGVKPLALKVLAELERLPWCNPGLAWDDEPTDLATCRRQLREVVDTGERQTSDFIGKIDNLPPEDLSHAVIRDWSNESSDIAAQLRALIDRTLFTSREIGERLRQRRAKMESGYGNTEPEWRFP